MAKTLKDLSRLSTDVRQIAKLLQKKAPPGHKLAYINEEEAAILKARGGSGRITPEGIPSYELDDNLQISGASPATETPTTAPVSMPDIQATTLSPASNTGDISAPSSLSTNYSIAPQAAGVPSTAPITSGFSPSADYSLTPAGTTFTPGGTAVGQTSDASAPQLGETGGQPIAATPTKPTDQSSLSKYLTSPEFAVRGATLSASSKVGHSKSKSFSPLVYSTW